MGVNRQYHLPFKESNVHFSVYSVEYEVAYQKQYHTNHTHYWDISPVSQYRYRSEVMWNHTDKQH